MQNHISSSYIISSRRSTISSLVESEFEAQLTKIILKIKVKRFCDKDNSEIFSNCEKNMSLNLYTVDREAVAASNN